MKTLIIGMLGYMDIILILGVVLILFGAKKVPELAKGLGTGIKEFKKATREVEEDLRSAIEDEPSPKLRQKQPPSASNSQKAD